ncbi:ABC transporter permease [Marinimicrobium sp. ABcell2]|uniref:ABC transporter permease n=1 Tax=Marinimicrobium sp. ABcell2 TaxID=3069751 RepID=UPI0027AF0FDE|nr:ABC transporter permease [Marinimicrobium sp. ABcell2]MDQ2075783.1 ABC transporter permease [Marinimicrobium sp. ABcell2]
MKQILTIAAWEFSRFFKWKQELITIFLMLTIVLGVALWPALVNHFATEQRIAVVTELELPQAPGFYFERISADEANRLIGAQSIAEGWHGVVQHENYALSLTTVNSAPWVDELGETLRRWLQQHTLANAQLEPEVMHWVTNPPQWQVQNIAPAPTSPEEREQNSAVVFLVLLLLGVSLFSGFACFFSAVTAEKQQRVTEQLLTLMTPQRWLDGKIVGITLFCLKTVATILMLMYLGGLGFSLYAGAGVFVPELPLLETLNALLFMLLGILLVNTLMGAFTATIDDPNHSSRSVVMLVPSIPIFIAYTLRDHPDSTLTVFSSLFPFTSFAVMPVRMAVDDVGVGEWLLSLALLLATLYWARRAGGRLFALGVRTYGQEPSWRQMGRAMLGKNPAG